MIVLMTGLGILVLSGLSAQDRVTRNEEVIRAHINSSGHSDVLEWVRDNERSINELRVSIARLEGKVDKANAQAVWGNRILVGIALAIATLVLDRLFRVYRNMKDTD